MNFLQLAQETNIYMGFQGTITSVSNLSGYQARLIQEIKRAWIDIQTERPEWDFLRKVVNFGTVALIDEYSLTTIFGTSDHDFGIWETDSIIYDYKLLEYLNYDYFLTLDNSESTGSEPGRYSIHPQSKALIFIPVNDIYTINAGYFRTPQILDADADIPLMPTKHHWSIIYKAAMGLSAFVGNQTLHQDASFNYSKAWGNLMRDENPAKHVIMRPLA